MVTENNLITQHDDSADLSRGEISQTSEQPQKGIIWVINNLLNIQLIEYVTNVVLLV